MARISEAEKIVIINIARSHSIRKTALIFNRRHNRVNNPISPTSVHRILMKIHRTGSIHRKKRYQPPTRMQRMFQRRVLQLFNRNVHTSIREAELRFGTKSRGTIHNILKSQNMHPYKMRKHQRLLETDASQRLRFCQQPRTHFQMDPTFAKKNTVYG